MDALMYKSLISLFFVENKLIHSRPERLAKCFDYVMNVKHYSDDKCCNTIKNGIANIDATFMKYWRRSKFNNMDRFLEAHESWVHQVFQLPEVPLSSLLSAASKGGRPKKSDFDTLSERTKHRRAGEISECELGILLLASAKAAKDTGKLDIEFVLKLLSKDEEVATKIRLLLKEEKLLTKKPKPIKITPLRGLTHILDNQLSKRQYLNTRLLQKECYSNVVLPAYNKILEAKKECRPPADCMKINEVCAALPLQALVNHTVSRLLLLQEEVIETVESNEVMIKFQGKWGGDGSSDQSRFNQKYGDGKSSANSDANLFATTFVPLRMTSNDGKIIWNNATPQSPRWCRPLRLQFVKETREFTLKEIKSVKEEVAQLIPYTTTIAGKKITVTYELYLTMIDGKVFAVITAGKSKSAQVCTMCDATPKQFNNLKNMDTRFKPKEGTLNYGISVLHLWIRSFEWLLHLSYRLNIKKWQVRGAVNKKKIKARKFKMQEEFWKEMNLRVDFPARGGNGNSNSGPVARSAFSKPEVLAKILELNVDLIKKVSTLLIALSCQLPLDKDLFCAFCNEIASFYVAEYKWFPMPVSVHKVLIHSRDILLANDLPLGVLAEDAAESCNKLYRHNRQFHASNASRKQNLLDVFNRALDSSDPVISSFSLRKRLNSRKRKRIPNDVLRLLKACEMDEISLLEENDDENDEDPLNEIFENLDGLNLPEDPMYTIDDEDDEGDFEGFENLIELNLPEEYDEGDFEGFDYLI